MVLSEAHRTPCDPPCPSDIIHWSPCHSDQAWDALHSCLRAVACALVSVMLFLQITGLVPVWVHLYSDCIFLVVLSPQLPFLKLHLPPVLSHPFSLAVRVYPGIESDLIFFFPLWTSGEISLFKEILSKTSLASTLKLLPPRSFFSFYLVI